MFDAFVSTNRPVVLRAVHLAAQARVLRQVLLTLMEGVPVHGDLEDLEQ